MAQDPEELAAAQAGDAKAEPPVDPDVPAEGTEPAPGEEAEPSAGPEGLPTAEELFASEDWDKDPKFQGLKSFIHKSIDSGVKAQTEQIHTQAVAERDRSAEFLERSVIFRGFRRQLALVVRRVS